MGTNFNWIFQDAVTSKGDIIPADHSNPILHIGKRSAAGLYCWDCLVTLCADGYEAIHISGSKWLDRCPCCGQEKGTDLVKAAMVELGLAQPTDEAKKGVASCASFSWAQDPCGVRNFCEKFPDEEVIEDEYGARLTGKQFLQMLEANCPVQFTHSVGEWFS